VQPIAQGDASSSRFPSPADARVLVVEDDDALVRAMVAALSTRGYQTFTATTGAAAIEFCTDDMPDLVLLDLGLPDLDGEEVCRHLRRFTHNPIIVLTADGAENRKVSALDLGADDYVTKPFSMPELHARIRVALRHRAVLAPLLEGAVVDVGALRIDVAGHLCVLAGERIELPRRQFALLVLLARNCGRVVTNNQMIEQVWGPDWSYNVAALRTHIVALRKKLAGVPGAPRIVTEARVGYRMLDPE
jgi:two-component system KDP operon response regulator KdpE